MKLELTDPVWFSYVHFKGQKQLSPHSVIKLPLLRLLATLSNKMEWLFSLLVLALALLPFILEPFFGPAAFVFIYFPVLVGVLMLKRIFFWRMFGADKKKLMVLSAEQIEVSPLVCAQLSETAVLSRQDIARVKVYHTFTHDQDVGSSGARASVNQIILVRKDHTEYKLDGYRIGLANVLYLLVYFDYPLEFIKQSIAHVPGHLWPLALRLIPICANVPALGQTLFALKSAF
ncbi:hypothetical protein [Pseudoalteromonas sp. T1lg48]|uniref:hypothetical protein n=1 Tax=Pseudoalteromonas sp. T1lg48 TaxID=2077100 RepID=UPI000CF6F8F7|nr:hypothetical protein [Pseudoalteromonas sp. T1lg48]